MTTLIVPAFTAGPNLQRTIDSCKGICDETVVICTALYDEDIAAIQKVAKAVILQWNAVFDKGFGWLYNQGSSAAKNDWLLLLGVSETFAERYGDFHHKLSLASTNVVYRCNHVNDPNQWKRVWNRKGGTHWSGLIHEEIVGGDSGIQDGGLIFRMQDIEKTPDPDPVRSEAFRFIKACSYHHQYQKLRNNPNMLGGTNPGWLDFVKGSKESNESFLDSHHDLMEHCLSGDKEAFKAAVEERVLQGVGAVGVNFGTQEQYNDKAERP